MNIMNLEIGTLEQGILIKNNFLGVNYMKNSNDFALDEIRQSIKRLQNKIEGRNVLFALIGLVLVTFVIVFAVIKFKEKLCCNDSEEFEDDLEDEDETYEDYRALDYEEEE